MTEENTNIPDTEAVVTAEASKSADNATQTEAKSEGRPFVRGQRPNFAKKRVIRKGGAPRRGERAPRERVKPEFDQKILDIRRVTRVVSGGRRFSFSVAIVIGDGKGRVGLGTGKSTDTSLAIEKAAKDARKKLLTLKLTKTNSIPHDLNAKFASSRIFMMPNRERGLIAGSSARVILSLAGVKDVTAKFHSGSKNKLNNGKVTIKALEMVAYKKGEEPIVKKVEMVENDETAKSAK